MVLEVIGAKRVSLAKIKVLAALWSFWKCQERIHFPTFARFQRLHSLAPTPSLFKASNGRRSLLYPAASPRPLLPSSRRFSEAHRPASFFRFHGHWAHSENPGQSLPQKVSCLAILIPSETIIPRCFVTEHITVSRGYVMDIFGESYMDDHTG